MSIYHVYCDGGCNNFTHSGAYGSFIILTEKEDTVIHLETFILDNTHSSNEAEYNTLIKTLEWIIEYSKYKIDSKFIIYSDSKLIVKQVTFNCRCDSKNLIPLHDKAVDLYHRRNIELLWLSRKIIKSWLGH